MFFYRNLYCKHLTSDTLENKICKTHAGFIVALLFFKGVYEILKDGFRNHMYMYEFIRLDMRTDAINYILS